MKLSNLNGTLAVLVNLEVKINVMLFSLAGKKVVWVHAVLKAMEITGVLLTRRE